MRVLQTLQVIIAFHTVFPVLGSTALSFLAILPCQSTFLLYLDQQPNPLLSQQPWSVNRGEGGKEGRNDPRAFDASKTVYSGAVGDIPSLGRLDMPGAHKQRAEVQRTRSICLALVWKRLFSVVSLI